MKLQNHQTSQTITAKQIEQMLPDKSSIGNERMLSYELNIRAILLAYMIGTGGFDICRIMTILGVGGGPEFERQFYRCSNFIHEKIIQVCVNVVQDALHEEMMLSRNAEIKYNATSSDIEMVNNDAANDDVLTSTNKCDIAPIDVATDMCS